MIFNSLWYFCWYTFSVSDSVMKNCTLRRILDLVEGCSDKCPPNANHPWGVSGCFPRKIWIYEVLRKLISSILKDYCRLSHALETTSFFSYFKRGLLLKIYNNRDQYRKRPEITVINLYLSRLWITLEFHQKWNQHAI